MKVAFFTLFLPLALLSAAPAPLMVKPGQPLVSWEFNPGDEVDAKGMKFRKETVYAVTEGSLHVTPPSLVKKEAGKKTKWGDSNFARAGLVGLPQDFVAWAHWKYNQPSDPAVLAKGLVYIDLGHRMIRVTFSREGAVLMLENHLIGRHDEKPVIVLQRAPDLKLRPNHWYDIIAEVKGDEVVIQIDDHVLYGKHDLIAGERYDTFNFDATGEGFRIDRIEVKAAGRHQTDWAKKRKRLAEVADQSRHP